MGRRKHAKSPESGAASASDVPIPQQPTLAGYAAKRNFHRSPEPAPESQAASATEEAAPPASVQFVVHKHWASRLHYDLRLELDGVLKSWAVPKGPSLDPRDRRMAIEVEDHPLAYADFEGLIPAGQYGAGKVLVWDRGFWRPIGDAHAAYREGRLKFELQGHKLHGLWTLIRMNPPRDKQPAWLLIKEKDSFARPIQSFNVVDALPDSVTPLDRPRGASATTSQSEGVATAQAASGRNSLHRLANEPRAKATDLPVQLSPQLATLSQTPPTDSDAWWYEVKLDGYRLLTRVDGYKVQLFTRNGHDWTARLPELAEAFQGLQAQGLAPGWYDGELVALNDQGVPDFQRLQQSFEGGGTAELLYFLFDLPFVAGYDVRSLTQAQRRELLEQALAQARAPSQPHAPGRDASTHPIRIRLSERFEAQARQALEAACRLGLEGVIAKRRDAPYVGRRSPSWIKLKCARRQAFVVAGYTEARDTRRPLGALLLGVYSDNKLRYAGSVGSGFDDRSLERLEAKLDTLRSPTLPFVSSATLPKRAHWVRPELVAEVSFSEWTPSGRIRHPVFQGLREDKPAQDIVREQAQSTPAVHATRASLKAGREPVPRPSRPTEQRATEQLPRGLHVSHPERVIDRVSGLHKIDVVRYYARVAPLMRKELKGRPVAWVRAPDGVNGDLFFQKHLDVRKMPGLRQLDPALNPGHPPLLTVDGAAGLAGLAQWNMLEVHSYNALASTFNTPDRMVFDLDPGEGVVWTQIQEAAALLGSFLRDLGLRPFLKTSGGKGLHVLVRLQKEHDWDSVKGFSHAVVSHLARLIPQRFVQKSGAQNRVGKIFIDYLRNGPGATTVTCWSVRARPGLGVSVPVDWSELADLRSADHWCLSNVHERLAVGNAPWHAYTRSAASLTRPMQRLGYRSK